MASSVAVSSMPRSRVPDPNTTIATMSEIWATKPVTLSSPPTVIAATLSSPQRWKKRMLTATRATVEGIARFTNVMANCRVVSRPNGIRIGAAAASAAAFATRGVWPMANASSRIGRLAAWTESTIVSIPTSSIADTIVTATMSKRTPSDDTTQREPSELLELLLLTAGGLDHHLAEVVDVEVGGVGRPSASPASARPVGRRR